MFALFIDVFVTLLVVIFGILAVTQILLPTIRGGILFPAFRKSLRTAQHDIETLTEVEEVVGLAEVARDKRAEIEKRTKAAAAANTIIDVTMLNR